MFCKADAGRYNKMTADIVECSEVDADLVILCHTSKCTADADYQPCRLKQTITFIKSVGCAVKCVVHRFIRHTLCAVL